MTSLTKTWTDVHYVASNKDDRIQHKTSKDGYYCNPSVVTLNIMYDLHNVINLSFDVSHVLVLSYYLVNNNICLK